MKDKNVNTDEFNENAPKIIEDLQNLEDPRKKTLNFQHSLQKILFITIVCCLSGADTWPVIVAQANAMKDWLSKFIDMSAGVPCERTFTRVFAVLNPKNLNEVLLRIAKREASKLKEGEVGDIISFDGKTMCGTRPDEDELRAIHMLNVWSHKLGICIAHKKIEDKSNEIPAVPKIMDSLDLKGTIITADALNTQRETAAKAIDKGADYVLPVKKNQSELFEEIELLFKEAQEREFCGIDADDIETIEKGHGRVEVRKYFSIDASELQSKEKWAGLNSAGMVIRERFLKGKSSREVQFYISSCEIDASLLARVTRGHWGIENSLHWVLDVIFREDKLRYRDRIGAQNLASVRKLALIPLSKDTKLKCGKASKRLIAATDPSYREHLLKLF